MPSKEFLIQHLQELINVLRANAVLDVPNRQTL